MSALLALFLLLLGGLAGYLLARYVVLKEAGRGSAPEGLRSNAAGARTPAQPDEAHGAAPARLRAPVADDELRPAPAGEPTGSGGADKHHAPAPPAAGAGAMSETSGSAATDDGGHDGAGGSAGRPPARLARPEGAADDLKQIRGIGAGIERTLNGLGIYHFHQIAAFTPENIEWVGGHLNFKGRIEREDWVGQARVLAVAHGQGNGPGEPAPHEPDRS